MQQLFTIEPNNALIFSFDPDSQKYTATIKVTNVSQSFAAFKVRLNNTYAYNVKPSIGVLKSGSSFDILVVLINQQQCKKSTDKFQIQAGVISQSEDPINYFKTCNKLVYHNLTWQRQGDSLTPSEVKQAGYPQSQPTTSSKYMTLSNTTDMFQSASTQKDSQIVSQVLNTNHSETSQILEQINKLNEELLAIKSKNNNSLDWRTFVLSICMAIFFGMYVAYK